MVQLSNKQKDFIALPLWKLFPELWKRVESFRLLFRAKSHTLGRTDSEKEFKQPIFNRS
jgi:hypothetical protein